MPKNLIVTMDNPDGTLDVAAIDRIIKGQLLPLMNVSCLAFKIAEILGFRLFYRVNSDSKGQLLPLFRKA